MTRIERRQARLARIRADTLEQPAEGGDCTGRTNVEHAEGRVDSRYVMASNQNQPFYLGSAAVNCSGAIHHDPYLIVSGHHLFLSKAQKMTGLMRRTLSQN